MLNDAVCFSQVYVVCGFTDLRSGIDKLAALIKVKTGNSPCIPDAQKRKFRLYYHCVL